MCSRVTNSEHTECILPMALNVINLHGLSWKSATIYRVLLKSTIHKKVDSTNRLSSEKLDSMMSTGKPKGSWASTRGSSIKKSYVGPSHVPVFSTHICSLFLLSVLKGHTWNLNQVTICKFIYPILHMHLFILNHLFAHLPGVNVIQHDTNSIWESYDLKSPALIHQLVHSDKNENTKFNIARVLGRLIYRWPADWNEIGNISAILFRPLC